MLLAKILLVNLIEIKLDYNYELEENMIISLCFILYGEEMYNDVKVIEYE